ncbi:MAG: hypothetical protein AYK19_00955 [Theionarchaea archaeon DG-70-1]|nr:MAG: hypothetical protein AYK19_00955 [Theionarchaea archaeon DG-70-1]
MKKTLRITAILLLFLLLPLNQQIFCEEDTPDISWKFEPRTDRSVHVEAVVLLRKSTYPYKFLEVSREIWVRNVKAYEYESKDPIEHNIYYDSETNKRVIMLLFSKSVPEPFTFGIEFDLMDFMEEEKDKAFIFEWSYRSEEEESHTGVVTLPKGAELLELRYLEPTKVEEGEQVIIYYEGKSKKHNDFTFLLVFSSSGREYVKMAKRYEESGDIDLALSYYQKAKSLYGRYNLISKTNPEILGELWEKICALQEIQADSAFKRAMEAFEQGNYRKAKPQFENLLNQYRILKDTERESKCREMITACEKMQRFKDAETLLEKGKNQFETFKYPWAKKSFIQARDEFEELRDAEKVSECEEWLHNVEVVYERILLCILGIVAILLALWEKVHGFW